MKKLLKWIGILLVIVICFAAVSVLYFKIKFESLADRIVEIKVSSINIPYDSISLERGKILAVSCRSCHGHDYAGSDFFNDPQIGYMSSPNLTPVKEGATEKYSGVDWIRSLRHGVNPAGRPLMVMPSQGIGLLSDNDLGCLIAFLKSVQAIEKPLGPTHFTFMAKVLAGAGMFGDLYPYDIIQHDQVRTISAPTKSNKPEYGGYMVGFHGCASCHGPSLNGAKSADPVSPPGSNITRGGNLGNWTLVQFKETLRGGKTPEGKVLDPKFMPWPGIGAHDDVELEALYNYIKSLPALSNSPELENKLKEK